VVASEFRVRVSESTPVLPVIRRGCDFRTVKLSINFNPIGWADPPLTSIKSTFYSTFLLPTQEIHKDPSMPNCFLLWNVSPDQLLQDVETVCIRLPGSLLLHVTEWVFVAFEIEMWRCVYYIYHRSPHQADFQVSASLLGNHNGQRSYKEIGLATSCCRNLSRSRRQGRWTHDYLTQPPNVFKTWFTEYPLFIQEISYLFNSKDRDPI
jgi:hypothetical protein